MFAMATETGLSHPFAMESALTMKHSFGNSPEVKAHPEVKPHRQTVMIEDNRMAIDSPSPKPSQARGDSETVRKKLRESLVSALEMVVGKQVVKSVLGVGKDLTEEERVEKSCPAGQVKREDEEEALQNQESQPAVGSESLEKSGNEMKVEDGEAGAQTANGAPLPSTTPSATNDFHVEMNESPSKKAKCSKEEGSQVSEETKGGLQLMEQVKQVAWDIEAQLFLYNGGVNKKYKEKARSLLFNLKDKSNPELRARVFNGEISPQILVRMTGEQLASKELSQWRTAKAEAFASMVVLTDADVDPRRIVKKTHKGEFQVMKEADLSPSVDAIEPPTSSFPIIVKKDSEEGGRADLSPGSNARVQDSTKNQRKSPCLSTEEVPRDKSSDGGAAAEGTVGDLPTIMSLDEYIDTREEGPSQRSESLHATPEGRTENKTNFATRESAILKTPAGSPSNVPDSSTSKLNRSPSVRNAEVVPSAVTLSRKRERESVGVLWEGSVQLSTSRLAPADGIFKSGERLELKDWPKSLEIKGRVRLGALDKFLQDLQLSRSRTVTVMSLCPSDRGGDVKQARINLKEMADQYRMGDRAGFVEPAQGFELYLLAPGCASLDVLSDLPSASNPTVERDGEVLVGVVVWRRNQSQGVPSARAPDHQIGSLKKVSLSNQVSESPTKVNTTPMHWTETPSSGGALPTSLKTASAHVNVSGNSSMHSTQSRGDSSATRDLSLRREWPPASGLQLSPVGVPTIRVTESVHAAMPDSLFLPHQSVELEDVPPGFLPRPLPTFPQSRPAGANVDSKERVPVIQPPYVGGVPGPASLLPDRGRETTEAPPGFWPRLPVKVLPISSQRFHTSSLDDDDDDLPEFNFEAEGVMAPQTPANLLPNQSQFLPPQNPISAPSQSPLHLGNLHNSDSSGRFQGHVNALPSPMEFQPVPPGLPPSRHVPLQEESFVPRASLHHGPLGGDGWKSSEIRTRESVQQSLHHEVARPMPPLNPDPRTLTLRGVRDEMVQREEDIRHYGLESQQRGLAPSHDQQRSFGAATTGPLGVKPARPFFAAGVRDTTASRNDLPEWCSPSVSNLQPVQRASIPSPMSYDSALHIRQQPPPPVHVVVQQHTVLKSNVVPNWVRGPAPQQQEPRYDYSRQVSVGNTPSNKWQLNSSQIHHNNRSIHAPRKVEIREKERTVEHSVKDTDRRRGGRDRSRVRERSRERSLSPTPEREREKAFERRVSRSPTPLRERSPQSREIRGINDHSSEQKEIKPPKRERERDQ